MRSAAKLEAENRVLRDYIGARDSTLSCSCSRCMWCDAIAAGEALLAKYRREDHERRVREAKARAAFDEAVRP